MRYLHICKVALYLADKHKHTNLLRCKGYPLQFRSDKICKIHASYFCVKNWLQIKEAIYFVRGGQSAYMAYCTRDKNDD